MSERTKIEHRPLTHAEVKLIKSLQLAKYRRQSNLFIAEGEKLIGEMLPAYRCQLLVGTEELVEPLLERCPESIAEAVILPDPKQIERVSGLKSPRPLLALCEIPTVEAPQAIQQPTLLLDDVQDPGNVGTLLRTCDWMGIRQVLCTEGCADVYAPKVLQATMGALARVHVYRYTDRTALLTMLTQTEIPVIGTFIDGAPLGTLRLAPEQPYILVLGNEGNGISPELSAIVSQRITIPSPVDSHCESLNVAVAGAIVMAHLIL